MRVTSACVTKLTHLLIITEDSSYLVSDVGQLFRLEPSEKKFGEIDMKLCFKILIFLAAVNVIACRPPEKKDAEEKQNTSIDGPF